jgi:hypothetical protein
MKPMMKCGHAANATTKGKPCCAICTGIRSGWNEIDEHAPSLDGRMAKCTCGKTVPSSMSLAFFENCPDKPNDRFYCGCYGWD